MRTVIHVSGFAAGADHTEMVSGVRAVVIEGELGDIAQRTIDAMRDCEKPRDIQVSTVRTLDGWLREVHAVVTIEGHEDRPMWHRFLTPDSDSWPIRPPDVAWQDGPDEGQMWTAP